MPAGRATGGPSLFCFSPPEADTGTTQPNLTKNQTSITIVTTMIHPPRHSTWAATASALLLLFMCLGLGTSARAQHTLVSDTAQWRVYDQGSGVSGSWTDNSFDDSSWKKAVGEIGWGDGDEDTVIVQPSASPTSGYTVYLRTKFHLKRTGGTSPNFTYDGVNGISITSLFIAGKRDDGFVAYINGTEVGRSNMPAGAVTYNTSATSNMEAGTETMSTLTLTNWKAACVDGENTLCIEVHQHTPSNNATNAADMSARLRLLGNGATDYIVRDPYVNDITTTSATIRWETTSAYYGRVWHDSTPDNLTGTPTQTNEGASRTDHVVTLTGLSANTTYSYATGNALTNTGAFFMSDASKHLTFKTAPSSASEAVHYLVMGNAGGANGATRGALDWYRTLHTTQTLRGLILLGDSAWTAGTNAQVTSNFFAPFQYTLNSAPAMVTLGDRDLATSSSSPELLAALTLPVVSSQSRYYSFDRGCVHFVCLDSRETNSTTRSNMLSWLDTDLDAVATTGKWIVAYFHDSPYTKGDETSEASPAGDHNIWMRQNVLDILEDHSTDVVFTSDSHTYERTPLLVGARGTPATTVADANFVDNSHGYDLGTDAGYGAYVKPVTKAAGQGTVYVTLGTGSGAVGTYGISGTAALDHAANLVLSGSDRGLLLPGFATLDASTSYLQVRFYENGNVSPADNFAILRNGLTLTASEYQGSARLVFSDPTTGSTAKYQIQRSTDGSTWSHLTYIAASSSEYVDGADFDASSIYYYRYRFVTESGGTIVTRNNLWSNTSSVSRRAEPSAPTISSVTPTVVNLAWNGTNLAGATVQIQRSDDGGSYSTIATVSASPATYADTPSGSATTYAYRIKAIWAAWDSNVTSSVTALRTPNTVSAVAGPGYVYLGGTGTYDLERSYNSGDFEPVTITSGGYDVTADTPGTYEYEGSYTLAGKLRCANVTTSANITTGDATLSVARVWTHPYTSNVPRMVFTISGGTYNVEVTEVIETIHETPVSVSSVGYRAFGPLEHNVPYQVKARLTLPGWAGEVQTFGLSAEALPEGLISCAAHSPSELRFSWYAMASGSDPITINEIRVNGVPVTPDGYSLWVDYSYYHTNSYVDIDVTNNYIGGVSYTESFYFPNIPEPPASVSTVDANATSESSCRIDWTYNDHPATTGFKIERSDGINGWSFIATIPDTGPGSYYYDDTGLQANTGYSYRVYAYGDGGLSTYVDDGATTPPQP